MNCGDRELSFDFATAAYRSRGVVRDLIHDFKYRRQVHLRHLLARMLREGFRDARLLEIDRTTITLVNLARLRELAQS